MKKIWISMAALSLLLSLSGCASLLERSYTVVEPYTNRYWDTAAEDTLRSESYQDLVNSLLMLVEQRAETGVIRYYAEDETDAYSLALTAMGEVQEETVLGTYLLLDISLAYAGGENYSTLTFEMTYRQTAEDPATLMVLSDTQSLVDLLRLAVREGHSKLSARFIQDVPRQEVEAAVDSLWQELHAPEQPPITNPSDLPDTPTEGEIGESGEPPVPTEDEDGVEAPTPDTPAEETAGDPDIPAEGEAPNSDPPEELPVAVPRCPWVLRFYPDRSAVGLVEIYLLGS